MNSLLKVTDNEIFSLVPPIICNNPRVKIEPEEVNDLQYLQHFKPQTTEEVNMIIPSSSNVPAPQYPLAIEWSPSIIFVEISDTIILQKIRVWNVCSRSIYISCCGLWGDTARLGARWRCYPRTRFLVSPGLTADLFVQAKPKQQSPVPSARITIQLSVAHKRDLVVGYFGIPVVVKFQKYIKPYLGEVEASNNNTATDN